MVKKFKTSDEANHQTENVPLPFDCDFCGYSTRRKDNLQAHIKRLHPDLASSSQNQSAERRHGIVGPRYVDQNELALALRHDSNGRHILYGSVRWLGDDEESFYHPRNDDHNLK